MQILDPIFDCGICQGFRVSLVFLSFCSFSGFVQGCGVGIEAGGGVGRSRTLWPESEAGWSR